ncbi:MAG: hypothetical protein AB8B73_01835 [Ekhidna sp.]
MNTKMNHLLTPTAAAASLLLLGSCVEDPEDPTIPEDPTPEDNADLLIGEWEVVSVDGEEYGFDADTASYKLVLKFESDGDFNFCNNYENKVDPSESYAYCFEGDWEWVTKGEEFTFTLEDEDEDEDGNVVVEEDVVNFKVTKLTETELEGDWTSEGEDENETFEVIMKKN